MQINIKSSEITTKSQWYILPSFSFFLCKFYATAIIFIGPLLLLLCVCHLFMSIVLDLLHLLLVTYYFLHNWAYICLSLKLCIHVSLVP